MQWTDLIIPVLAGAFSYIGAFAAVRTDIRWIRETLDRHEKEHHVLHQRIDRGRDAITELKSK